MADRILLADVVATVHALFSAFIVGGCVAFGAGRILRWRWTNARLLRAVHLAFIGFITLRTWTGSRCPLNMLETWLRQDAHADGSLARMCHRAFFKGVDPRQFTVCVTMLALLVLADWVWTYKQVE